MTEVNLDAAAQRIAQEFNRLGTPAAARVGNDEGGFGQLLEKYVRDTDGIQKQADDSVSKLVSGEKQNVHEVMLDVARADISFRMMLEVRNKLVEAYQEVMRMSV